MSTILASPVSLAHALMTRPGHTKKLPPAIVLLCPSASFGGPRPPQLWNVSRSGHHWFCAGLCIFYFNLASTQHRITESVAVKFFHGDTATHPHCPQEARAGVICVSGTGHLRMCLGNWYQLNIAVLIYLKPLDSYIILLISCVCCFRGPSSPPKTCEKSSTDERLLEEIWSAIRSTTCSIAVFLHFWVTKSQNKKLVKTFAGLPLDRLRDEFGG